MAKVYLIKHMYDVDGGFGDAVPTEKIIGASADKAEAEAFVKRWDAPKVYDKPYAELEYHSLEMEEVEIGTLRMDVDPIPNPPYMRWQE